MSSFNIFAMAFLLALVVIKGADLVADGLVHPIMLKKNVYIVRGVPQQNGGQTEKKPPGIEAIEPLLAAANLEKGRKIAKKCLQCHTFTKDGKAKTGPNLWNVIGRPIGKLAGYAYSKAMKTHGGEWGYKQLNEYLYKPRKSVPGTKMSFAGLKKVQHRADLIAYMRTMSETPKPLPILATPVAAVSATEKKAASAA